LTIEISSRGYVLHIKFIVINLSVIVIQRVKLSPAKKTKNNKKTIQLNPEGCASPLKLSNTFC